MDKAKFQEMAKELTEKHAERLKEKYGGKEVPIYDVQYDY